MSADAHVIEAALRSITDCGEREFYAAIRQRQDDFARGGTINSGRAEICQSEDLATFFRDRSQAVVTKIQLARDVVPSEHVHQLREALETLRDSVLSWRRSKLNRAGSITKSADSVQRIMGPLEDDMNKAIEDAARDVEHFHPASGRTKQGDVIVTGNTGNTNVAAGAHAKAAQQVGAELNDLAEIITRARQEVLAASDSPDKIEALDHLEVIETKIRENAPRDQIGRWLRRGLETCEKIGVASAGPLISAWLRSHGM